MKIALLIVAFLASHAAASSRTFVESTDNRISFTLVEFAGEFTAMVWVRKTNTDREMLVGGFNVNGQWGFGISTADMLLRDNAPFGGAHLLTLSIVPALNEWSHIAVVRNGANEIRAYVNGVESSTAPFVIAGSKYFNYIGGRSDNSATFRLDGDLYDLKLYGRALSVPELQQAMRCRNMPAGAVVQLVLDEDGATPGAFENVGAFATDGSCASTCPSQTTTTPPVWVCQS